MGFPLCWWALVMDHRQPKLLVLLLLILCTGGMPEAHRLQEVFAWKTVDFVFPDAGTRERLLTSEQFLPYRTMPLGLEVWQDKLFLTIPRRKAGVPCTLGYINLSSTERSPLLTPYPDWFTNSLADPTDPDGSIHITTAYRIRADACDRLWVIDTGLADIGTGFVQLTHPQLLIYDLHTDVLLLRYQLKDTDYRQGSFFANIAVDVTAGNCADAFAYIPDLGASGLVVFSLRNSDSWRITHNFFHLDPLAGNFNIDGLNFQLSDGIFAVALSALKEDGFRTLYFHSLSSYNEFAVSTRILHNKTIANKSFNEFKNLGSRGDKSQSSGTFLDEETGVLFFMEVHNHAVTCWNTVEHPDMPGNIGVLAKDETSHAFVYPCDVKVDRNRTLWVLNNNIPRYIFSNLDSEQYNYFIFKATVEDIIRGTVCDTVPSCRAADQSILFRTTRPPTQTLASASKQPTTAKPQKESYSPFFFSWDYE